MTTYLPRGSVLNIEAKDLLATPEGTTKIWNKITEHNRSDIGISVERIEKVVIKHHKVLIIEGVGSSSSEISEHACLKLWIEVDKEIGISRVLTRDGQQIQEQMKKWQTRESKFFIENNSKENSDVWIDGDPVVKIDTSSQFVRTNR